MPTLFKKCPNCGKRFEVQHTGESIEKTEEVVPLQKEIYPVDAIGGAYPVAVADPPSLGSKKITVATAIEEDTYSETYRCKHCGYEWTEKRETYK